MEIDPRLAASTPTPVATAGATVAPTAAVAAQGWFAGQELTARVIAEPEGDRVALQIGDRVYSAQVSFAVRKGDELLLEVVRTAPAPLLLRPIAASGSSDPLRTLLLTDLPRQSGLTPLLARLAAIAATASGSTEPQPVVKAARELFAGFLDSGRVRESGQLRDALANAGTLLEARLAAAARTGQPPEVARDLKAGLLRLLGTLLPDPAAAASGVPAVPRSGSSGTVPLLPPLDASQPQAQPRLAVPPGHAERLNIGTPAAVLDDLRGEVESSLARIQLQQLGSLPGANPDQNIWLLELPIRHGAGADLWQLRIERQPGERTNADDPDSRKVWSVRLAFSLEGLGPVHAHIRQQGDLVSVRFWVEHPATLALFEERSAALRSDLVTAGVNVGAIHCHPGSPPEPVRGAHRPLVDARA